MKMRIVLTAMLMMLCAVAAVSAQKKMTNFSGQWNLNVSKSKLDERARIESMTMTVAQTDKEIKIDSSVKRAPRPEGDGERRGGMINGGMRRGGGGMGGDSSNTFTLDGKAVVKDLTAQAAGKFTTQATPEKDGKLKLMETREFDSPMGRMAVKTTELWSLSADGKTLTVKRDMESARGTNSSELIFTKQ